MSEKKAPAVEILVNATTQSRKKKRFSRLVKPHRAPPHVRELLVERSRRRARCQPMARPDRRGGGGHAPRGRAAPRSVPRGCDFWGGTTIPGNVPRLARAAHASAEPGRLVRGPRARADGRLEPLRAAEGPPRRLRRRGRHAAPGLVRARKRRALRRTRVGRVLRGGRRRRLRRPASRRPRGGREQRRRRFLLCVFLTREERRRTPRPACPPRRGDQVLRGPTGVRLRALRGRARRRARRGDADVSPGAARRQVFAEAFFDER